MRKNATYGLVAAVVAAAVVLGAAMTVLANPNPWWDDRLDGAGPVEYGGAVLYDVDVLEAPISLPEPTGWHVGHVQVDASTLTYTDAYGNTNTAQYHPETGCYLDWDGEFDVPLTAYCYDGSVSIDAWYGTLHWDGHQGVLVGPWLYHVYITVPQGAFPRRHQQALE
jgi:hypothetical protein